MNSKTDQYNGVIASKENSPASFTEQAPLPVAVQQASTQLGRFSNWLAARIRAHEDRVTSLRVYSEHRLDGVISAARKD